MTDAERFVELLGDPCPEWRPDWPVPLAVSADEVPMTYRDVLNAVLIRLRSRPRISFDGDDACALAFPCYLYQYPEVPS